MKLTYEDCKELKDAGFPQDPTFQPEGMRPAYMQIIWNDGWEQVVTTRPDLEKGKFWRVRDEAVYTLDELKAESLVAKVPSLSELIEECGEEFDFMDRPWNEDGKSRRFRAVKRYGTWTEGNGSSPEQAVKNLWIALNKTQV